jgi:hypothetical protein
VRRSGGLTCRSWRPQVTVVDRSVPLPMALRHDDLASRWQATDCKEVVSVPVLPASFKVGDHVGRSGSDRSSPWFAASSDAAGTDGTAVYKLAEGTSRYARSHGGGVQDSAPASVRTTGAACRRGARPGAP